MFINNKSLYQSFGFVKERPILIGLVLFNEILAPMDIVLTFTMNVISRRYEFEAGMDMLSHCHSSCFMQLTAVSDAFAVKLGYAKDLASSLIKLQIQNLSTMDADWLYATYHYSHPILPERLNALGWHGKTSGAADEKESVVKAGDREL